MTYGPQGDPVSVPQETPKTQPAGVAPSIIERPEHEVRLLADDVAPSSSAATEGGARDYKAIVKRAEALVPAWEHVLANTMQKGDYERGQRNDLATRIDELRDVLGI